MDRQEKGSGPSLRRLRHINRIVFRNLKGPLVTGPCDCFFTLSFDTEGEQFFTSSTIRKTLNPSWPSLSESLCSGTRANRTSCRFRLYKSKGADAGEAEKPPHSRANDSAQSEHEVLYEATISMQNLESVHCLKPRVLPRMPVNTLLLFLPDGIYCLGHLSKLVRQKTRTPSLGLDGVAFEAAEASTTVDAILNSCERALKHEAVVRKVREEAAAAQSQIALRIEQEAARLQQTRTQAQKAERVKDLQRLCEAEARRLRDDRKRVLELRQALAPRAQLLIECCRTLSAHKEEAEETRRRALYAKKVVLDAIEKKYEGRRRKLLNALAFVYPLTAKALKTGSGQGAQGTEKLMTIRQLPLPAVMVSVDEDQLSTALGYVAHLVCMLAKYLEVPLRFRLVYLGSRSCIVDDVNAFAPFPLYKTGVDINRFKAGLQMLNLNVHHLLNLCVPDWNKARPEAKTLQLLENLKLLLCSQVPGLQND